MIRLENVTKFYNNSNNVSLGLKNISLNFEANEIVGIVGDSGSGKTTLLNVITGLDTFNEGEIYFGNMEFSACTKDQLESYRKNQVGFIFQNYNLINSYTVLQNVMFPLLIKGYEKKEAKRKALDLINKVGLNKRINNKATKLSGGEKQRLCIARSLAIDPLILACDEPTGNLDSKTSKEIIELIKEVAKDKLVLIVTHNYEEISHIATRQIRISDGMVVLDKKIKETNNDVELIDDENYKVSSSVYPKIAFRNIISTPKRSLFIMMIFIVLSFISIFEFVSFIDSFKSFSSNYQNIDYCMENSVVITNYGKKINIEELNNEDFSYILPFSQDFAFYAYNTSKDYDISGRICFGDSFGYKLKGGRYPEKSNEVCIPGKYINDYQNFLNINITLFEKYRYHVVGVTDGDMFLIKTSEYKNYLTTERIRFRDVPSTIGGIQVAFGNVTNPILYIRDDTTIDNITIYLNDCPLTYSVTNEKDMGYYQLILSYDEYFRIFCEEMPIEILCITNDIDKTINKAKELGYQAYDLGNAYQIYDYGIIDFFSFIFTIFGLIIEIVISYFISMLVLSLVLKSKKQDYLIMRGLGISEKKMNLILQIEIVLEMLIAFILTILIGLFMNNVFSGNKVMFFENPGQIAIMLVFIIALGLALSRSFNHRLFKDSLSKSLREDK